MKTVNIFSVVLLAALAACGQNNQASTSAQRSAPAAAPSTGTAADKPSAAAAIAAASPTTSQRTMADAAVPSTSTMGAGAGDAVNGEKIYSTTCVACHGPGLLNAPKIGDKTAWAPRVAKGKDMLYKDALNGLNAMPPRGGNGSLKDDEVKAAVDYMVSKAK